MAYYRAGGLFEVLEAAGKVWKGRKAGPNVDRFSGEPGHQLGIEWWKTADPDYGAALAREPGAITRWVNKKKGPTDMGYYTAGGGVLKSDAGYTWGAPAFGGGSSSVQVPMRDSAPAAANELMHGERRRPRMNPTNVRALRRSMRRVTSFARIAKRVMSFTHHHKMKVRRKRAFGK